MGRRDRQQRAAPELAASLTAASPLTLSALPTDPISCSSRSAVPAVAKATPTARARAASVARRPATRIAAQRGLGLARRSRRSETE